MSENATITKKYNFGKTETIFTIFGGMVVILFIIAGILCIRKVRVKRRLKEEKKKRRKIHKQRENHYEHNNTKEEISDNNSQNDDEENQKNEEQTHESLEIEVEYENNKNKKEEMKNDVITFKQFTNQKKVKLLC